MYLVLCKLRNGNSCAQFISERKEPFNWIKRGNTDCCLHAGEGRHKIRRKEGRLRILEPGERQKRGQRGEDKMEPIGEEEEPEPHNSGSHKYWGFLRQMINQ